jgi:hypothetical protein
MASQLRLLHAQYMERAKLNLWEFYTNKLKVRVQQKKANKVQKIK